MKRLLLFIILIITFYLQNNASTTINGGDVYGTWTLAGSPYLIKKNISIPDDSVLIIMPGVEVQLDSMVEIDVIGTIKAIGNVSQRIRFRASDTIMNSTLTLKGWAGIRFLDSGTMYDNDTSDLIYCTLDHSKNSLVYVKNVNKIIIDKCLFRKGYSNSGSALYLEGTNLKLSNCIIYDNYTANSASLYLYNSNCYVSGNIISNNRAASGGSGLSLAQNSNGIFVGNIICNNSCLSCSGLMDGAGVRILSSSPEFYNCDIVYNSSNARCGGILLHDNSDAIFENCIIYYNGKGAVADSQIYLYDNFSDPNFYYCDIRFGSTGFMKNTGVTYEGTYSRNLNTSPVFTTVPGGLGSGYNGTAANWRLFSRSGLINAGKPGSESKLPSLDFYSNKRLYYGIPDIGAAEYNRQSANYTSDITSDEICYADTINLMANDSIRILDGVTFTVPPGVIVKSYYNYPLLVEGTLEAVGTPNNRIIFTYYDTTGYASNRLSGSYNTWKGIRIINPASGSMFDNDSTKIEYCDIECVKNTASSNGDGAIYVDNFQKVIIQNSQIKHYTGGSHGAIVTMNNANILIDNNEIFDNILTGKSAYGAGIYVAISDPVISNNQIYNNISQQGNGGGIYLTRSNAIIFNNVITNNSAFTNGGGIYLVTADLASIYNNVIQNNRANSSGGGIYTASNIKYFFNNTVAYNYSGSMGGGIFANGSYMDIYNSILYGNEPQQIYLGVSLNDLNIYNSDVQGGINSFGSAQDLKYYGINYINNLDTLPIFKKPPVYPGLLSDGLASDLSIKCISPCINKGLNDIDGVQMPDGDILNNQRIEADTIDMGAYEVIPSQVQIVEQPKGKLLCEGDNITISILTKDTAIYQWQKDGVDLPGAKGNTFSIASATGDDEGNYICIASNAFGKTFSNSVFLKVRIAPDITAEPTSSLIDKNSPVTLIAKADGSKPLTHKWIKDGIELPDTTFKLYIDSFRTENEGTYICEMTNACGTVTTDPAILNLTPAICMVTVSTPTPGKKGHNKILFDKESKINYTDYKIYRESDYAGLYLNIGTVSSTQPGIFLDTVVDPNEQAYLYKITGIESDFSETDINSSQIHKPIHLLATKGEMGGVQLDWDQYDGFDYNTYYIYRKSTTEDSFRVVHTMSSSTQTWTDDTVVSTNDTLFYYVSVRKAGGCNPNGSRKGSSDIYSQSASNMEDNRLKSTDIKKTDIDEFNLRCYPNPFNNLANIRYNINSTSHVVISLYNTLGSKLAVLTDDILLSGEYKYMLNARKLNLSSGVYILKFSAGNRTLEKILVLAE